MLAHIARMIITGVIFGILRRRPLEDRHPAIVVLSRGTAPFGGRIAGFLEAWMTPPTRSLVESHSLLCPHQRRLSALTLRNKSARK